MPEQEKDEYVLFKSLPTLTDGVELDEQNHQYKLNGVEVPGTTSIIYALDTSYRDVGPKLSKIIAAKGELGKRVHKATELFDSPDYYGEKEYASSKADLQPQDKAYFDAYCKFAWDYAFSPDDIERVCVGSFVWAGETYRYGMTFDRTGTLRVPGEDTRDYWVLDVKCTRKVNYPKWGLQLGAYKHGVNNIEGHRQVTRSGIVHLRPDGTYRLMEVDDDGRYIHTFASTIHTLRFFNVC